jgi:hypothetical protein
VEKDTYSIKTIAQKQQDDHNRMVIATHLMAAMVTPNDILRRGAEQDIAARAVDLADELIKALK